MKNLNNVHNVIFRSKLIGIILFRMVVTLSIFVGFQSIVFCMSEDDSLYTSSDDKQITNTSIKQADNPGVNFKEMTTQILIEYFIDSDRFIGLGAFDYFDIQQSGIVRSDIVQEIFKRPDKVEKIITIYNSIATRDNKIHYQYSYNCMDLMISSKVFINSLSENQKYEIMTTCYKWYLVRVGKGHHMHSSILHVFANILESEGMFEMKHETEMIHISDYYSHTDEIIKKTIEYIENSKRRLELDKKE